MARLCLFFCSEACPPVDSLGGGVGSRDLSGPECWGPQMAGRSRLGWTWLWSRAGYGLHHPEANRQGQAGPAPLGLLQPSYLVPKQLGTIVGAQPQENGAPPQVPAGRRKMEEYGVTSSLTPAPFLRQKAVEAGHSRIFSVRPG